MIAVCIVLDIQNVHLKVRNSEHIQYIHYNNSKKRGYP
jgi:hypothetical protein